MRFFILNLMGIMYALNIQSQTLSYSEQSSIACHNCFEPNAAAIIEDVLQFTKTIELDIWDTKRWFGIGGWQAMERNWFVRHLPYDEGNINCCGGSFHDCLLRLKNWSAAHENHGVITIFIDKKENWSDQDETRKPGDLDMLIKSLFPSEMIFQPANLRGGDISLRNHVLTKGWPSLDSLKGKFIFVLTDATMLTSRNVLNEYLNSQKDNAVCFVAPQISEEKEIENPKGFSIENISNIVFYNFPYSNKSLAVKINAKKRISRVFDAIETRAACLELGSLHVNFIALDNYKLQL